MAANNAEELDLQIPEKTDALLFAEDLVDFLLFKYGSKNGTKWEPIVFRNHSYNTFAPIVRRTIHFIHSTLEYNHEQLHGKMKKANLFNSYSFGRFNQILIAKCFPGCFEAKYFLLYCVNLTIMTTYFGIEGICDAPYLAKQYIYQRFKLYESAGGWDAICRIAEHHVKMLRDSLNELDISSVSDEVEYQDQKEEEGSSGSSSSPSEKECVSSRQLGSNIEYHTECACAEIKIYLKCQAQYPSESDSQIGLCSLRKPELSSEDESLTNKEMNVSESDDEPRHCKSNVDQELIRIIADFKIMTNMLWNKIKLIDISSS